MTPFDFHLPTRLLFGAGAIDRIGELARDRGFKRALVVSDSGLEEAGHVDRALGLLRKAGIECEVFDDFDVNPDAAMVDRGVAFAAGRDFDSVIGLGGGSSLDCAKAINLLLTNGGAMADYRGYGHARRPLLPMFAVPTTAGTGSEAQSYAVIADSATHMKMACGDPKLAFAVAVLDPELTYSQPPAVTAAAGFDAIAHAVETAVTRRRSAISTLFSREAFRLLDGHYQRVLDEPHDLAARSAMQLGAYYAGVAIEQSMLGAAHACANPLTARYDLTHGIALAILLPHIVRWNAKSGPNLYGELVGLAASAAEESAGEYLAARLTAIGRSGGFPADLRTAGVPAEDLSALAEAAGQQWTGTFNPEAIRLTRSTGGLSMRVLSDTPRHAPGAAGSVVAFTAVLALSGAAGAAAQPAPADAWTQFRGTPALTGASAAVVPAELELLWTFEAGESIDSSAAVVDGTVYVGTYTGELIAVDLESGTPKWRYRASERMGIGESSPAVGGGRVYVGDLAGVLHAVDADTGAAVWTFPTQGEIKSSPVVVGDRVLVGSYDGYLYGLDTATGDLAWQVETQNYVHATPAISDGVAYFGGCDETFHGVRISDGVEVVSLPAGAYTAASSAIHDGRAYFGTFDNEVLGLDLTTHEILWRYEHPRRHFPFYSSALHVDGRVVIGGRDRMVHAIDERTGEALWTFMTRARVDSSPAASGGRVYIGSGDGRLYVLDLETGDKVWEFDTGAPLSASPAIAEGKVVIGSQDGVLYCFG